MKTYKWTTQNIYTTVGGKDYDFVKGEVYDLEPVFDEPWIKDALARKYFVEEKTESSEEIQDDSEMIEE